MMEFFKIINKNNWHFSNNGGSLCNSASTEPYRYPKGVNQEEYAEIRNVEIILEDMKDNLCQACVRQAYKEGLIKVQLKERLKYDI